MTGLPDLLRTSLRDLAGRRPLLVALDFDGVLAPLVTRAGDARPLPAAVSAVRRLVAEDDVHVALVSGRALADLRAVADPPPGVVLVASHGAETDGAPAPPVPRDLLAAVAAAVEDVVARHAGTTAEHKPTAAVLHTRAAERDVAAAATAAVLDAVAALDGAHVLRGKEVVEVSVVPADKGTALRSLRERLHVAAVLYVGDDVTDENAFRTLDPDAGDVAVKVGSGPTVAGHRVDAPEDVAVLLAALADALAGEDVAQ